MKITTRGATTTVAVDGRIFKIVYNQRNRRLQIRENQRLATEAFSFQQALNAVEDLANKHLGVKL